MKELEHLTQEESRLIELEETITAGKFSFVQVGNALSEILANELYKPKYKTFAKYVEARWGFSRQYADYMIKGCEVMKSLPEDLTTMVDNPRKARAAARVPKEKRSETIRAAQAKADAEGREMTARDIADELAKSHPIKPDDSEPVDVESEVVETESAYDRHSNNIRNAWTEFMDEADKDSIDKMIKMFRERIKDMQKRRAA